MAEPMLNEACVLSAMLELSDAVMAKRSADESPMFTPALSVTVPAAVMALTEMSLVVSLMPFKISVKF